MRDIYAKQNGWLGWLILLAIFSVGIAVQTVHAVPKDKKSKRLSRQMQQVANDDFIDVIIQPTSNWSGNLNRDLSDRGASRTKSFNNFAFKVYRVKRKDIDLIAARSDVDYMTLDAEVKTLGHVAKTTGAEAIRGLNGSNELNGDGIGIAIVDSGIDSSHISFNTGGNNTSIIYSRDFTGENRTDDPYGHGTHVAGLAAGSNKLSGGAYEGIAPRANLINLRVLNSEGTGSISSILAALDWIYTNRNNSTLKMRVVNISLGTNALDSYRLDPICLAVRKLVDAGIVVVAAAGNEGKDETGSKIYGQIHSPGNEPSAITVGAVNSYGTDVRSDDVMTTYSSRGPTRSFYTDSNGVNHYDNLIKPDLVAPGNKLVSAQANSNRLVRQNPDLYANTAGSSARKMMRLSGTSMSAPTVAGASALMLQANPNLTPNMIKMILMYTAQTINGANMFEQGAGQLNIDGAVRLAKLVRRDLTSSTPVGSPLLTSTNTLSPDIVLLGQLTASPASVVSGPLPKSSIAGQSFIWGQGVIMGHTFATGTKLITEYQGIYGQGRLFSDGTVESDGVMMGDGVLLSDGVMMGDHILTGNGALMSDGYPFLNCGVMMGDGVLLSDGVMMGDGVLLGDGVLIGDSIKADALALKALESMIRGDQTAAMAAP